LFADAQRLSQATEAFREEKHHLYYRRRALASFRPYVSDRQQTTVDDVLPASRLVA
jgi:hypothetical protein